MTNVFKKTALAAVAGLALAATPAFAADGNPAEETGTAKVRILQALSINNDDGTLDFGVLVKDSTNDGLATSYSNFNVATDGTFGGCATDWSCSGVKTEATFVVTGAADEQVQVTIDPSVDLDGTAGATNDILDVALALSGDADNDSDATLTLTGGEATFTVGGTLTVRHDVATGTYDETFNVTATYL